MEQQVIDNGTALPAEIVPKGIARSTMVAGSRPRGIVPTDIEQVWRLAVIISKSGMAPKDFDTQEKITVALMHGLEVGLPPMMALQRIAVINNRACVWGDAVPALALATGQVEDWEERIDGEGDLMVATCRVKRKGIRSPAQRSFSVEDAKKARLWGKAGPWQQYPRRMLAMRARVAFRDLFADALGGLYIAEEVIGIEDRADGAVDVTPKTNGKAKAAAPALEPFPEPSPAKVTPERYKELTEAGVTPLKMSPEAAAILLAQGEPAPAKPAGKPLPPTISRKVAQQPAPTAVQAPAQGDGLDIPEALRRKPAGPDPIAETTRFKIWLNDTFASKKTLDEIQTLWNDTVLPRFSDLDSDNQDDLMAILDHHERRF